MAISPEDHVRVAELAEELLWITGGRYRDDGLPKTFDEIETEASVVADLVASWSSNRLPRISPRRRSAFAALSATGFHEDYFSGIGRLASSVRRLRV